MKTRDWAKEWMVNDGSTGGRSPSPYRSQSLGGEDRATIGDQGVALVPTQCWVGVNAHRGSILLSRGNCLITMTHTAARMMECLLASCT